MGDKNDKDIRENPTDNTKNSDAIKETITLFKEEVESLKNEIATLKAGILPVEEMERLKGINVESFTKILDNKTNDLLASLIIKASANAVSNLKDTKTTSIADILKLKEK